MCGHRLGDVVKIFGRRSSPQIILCQCVCHSHCSIASDRPITRVTWESECHCPGAEAERQRLSDFAEERAERRRVTDEIRASIDLPGTKTKEQLGVELEQVYRRRGIAPEPGELAAQVRVLKAMSDPER